MKTTLLEKTVVAPRRRSTRIPNIQYIDNPGFSESDANKQFNTSGVELLSFDSNRLSREEEIAFFLRMNYARYRAFRSPDADAPNWINLANKYKNIIARCHIDTAYFWAKKNGSALDEEIESAALLGLSQSINMFDASRDARFNTYCSCAIQRHIWKYKKDKKKHFMCVIYEEFIEDDTIHSEDEHLDVVDCTIDVRQLLVNSELSNIEQSILMQRFGLYGVKAKKLSELGQDLGISRERVRQLEARAIRKIRLRLHSGDADLN